MVSIQDIYVDFIGVLDACEQIDNTPMYLGLLEVMKQDIEERQNACVKYNMRPDLMK